MRKTRTMLAVLILCMAASSALGRKVWYWTLPYLIVPEDEPTSQERYYLTGDNSSHAVAMTKYSGGTKVWTSILAQRWINTIWDPYEEHIGALQAYEYQDVGSDWHSWAQSDSWPFAPDTSPEYRAVNCHVASNPLHKVYTWGSPCRAYPWNVTGGHGVPTDDRPVSYQGSAWWNTTHDFSASYNDTLAKDMGVAVAMFKGPNDAARARGVAVWVAHNFSEGGSGHIELRRTGTSDGGANWHAGDNHSILEIDAAHSDTWWRRPSLATDDLNGANAYLAYESTYTDGASSSKIVFRRSTNWGDDWNQNVAVLGYGDGPCVAAVGHFVFVSWTRFLGTQNKTRRILYRYSTDCGANWVPDAGDPPDTVPFAVYPQAFRYELSNVAAVPLPDQTHPGVLLVARLGYPFDNVASNHWWTTRGMLARFYGTTVYWEKLMPLCTDFVNNVNGEPLNPSIAAITADGLNNLPLPVQPDAIATCVMSTPAFYRFPLGYGHHIRKANGYYADRTYDAAPNASTARLLAMRTDGTKHYGCSSWPYIAAGQIVEGSPIYDFGETGKMPALALDGEGGRWVAYVSQDTLWCYGGYGDPSVVFAGSSSAVPGQPSIVCYPNQANGVYVGNVVFPVYDTTGGTSKILYARVDTSTVVLDTIESVANLGDSLPCINVYKTDSLFVTWQHGDSTLAAMLCDYGPGTSGQVPAWSSPSLVSANGYHAMSSFDEGGSALNVVWARNNGSNYAIQRATCDLASSLFGNWSQSATPGDTGTYEKSNPVFAGLGVTCWQQKDANGKWIIKGYVRGEEETFVDNDTDAYHPHAVAESSAISPSIDQVRVSILYTAGVTFEVDSGLFDTGDVRFTTCSLSVSRATSDATKSNNGAKLLRKNGLDSLFSVYSDLDNAVVFAWSANGDTWQRAIMATSRDNPAIAEDSTGKRWVVVHKAPVGMVNGAQEAYYRNGSSWTGPQTLYSAGAASPIGPASIAGASSTTSSFGYAAFLTTSGANKSVVVAKFNGTTVSTYTLATGTTLGDPAIAVEPYKSDSDHVHVIWDDNGIVKYSMAADSRGSSISTTWTTPYVLTGGGVTGHHPIIGANRSRIVVAWAQGATADIYSRKRAASNAYNNWDAAANLSNTANNASDWPTIAMGDTVVVAWEETRSGGSDFDILACIEFGDTINVADNPTVSSYPHVVFQNKTSGDTLIPYLMSIWAETPEASYYEVRFNKLNLKHPTGEGQQSASTLPIPVKPVLASCSPNPFRNHTQINYALPTAGNVSLRVYDVTGRTVRTLASGSQKAGSYTVSWDARDSHGKQVPYGVYFYRLDTPGFRSVKKAVVAR
jgi:hypothetical protein